MRRLRLLAVALLLLFAVPLGWAADLPVSVVTLSSPVVPFDDATLEIQTATTPGQWPIDVTCEKGEARGEVRTTFQVRLTR